MTIQAIILFHRDLRIIDNDLVELCSGLSSEVLPLFIFDNRQVSSSNEYRSSNSIQFMVESLLDLKNNIPLRFAHGITHEILQKILKENSTIKAIYSHSDITPFAQERDDACREICEKAGVEWIQTNKEFLNQVPVLKPDGSPYVVFTYFYKKFLEENNIPKPKTDVLKVKWASISTRKTNSWEYTQDIRNFVPKWNEHLLHHGGRVSLLRRWKEMIQDVKNYPESHDKPAESTTELSAALKFGVLSAREAVWWLRRDLSKNAAEQIVRQILFREFYFQIIQHFPLILSKQVAFDKKWEDFPTKYNERYWRAWIEGKTGIPIIDAGMRQMLTTGFMHNRVRMLSASVLFKDMGIDWREGEKFFAQMLYDYDPSQNNQGWQSTCGMGASALPYFRVMNPWVQQEKFDPEAKYIKTWIPELRDYSAKEIHQWKGAKNCDYPAPVLNHSEQAKLFLQKAKEYLSKQ